MKSRCFFEVSPKRTSLIMGGPGEQNTTNEVTVSRANDPSEPLLDRDREPDPVDSAADVKSDTVVQVNDGLDESSPTSAGANQVQSPLSDNEAAKEPLIASTSETKSSGSSTLLTEVGHARGDIDDSFVEPAPAAPPKSVRLQSLDVFRGITIAWMIFVDNVGASWPSVDHSAWDGAAPADFVMPSFDFIVGVAAVFSLHRFTKEGATTGDRCAATKKIIIRFVKLFLLGIATQCGVDLFVYNMSMLRIMGILQRVACCYLVAALAEVWSCNCCCSSRFELPDSYNRPGCGGVLSDHFAIIRQHGSQFVVGIILISVHLAILYGVDVPDFEDGDRPGVSIKCGRGVLTPACNAAAHVDRLIFGVNHMYFPANGGGDGRGVTFQRLDVCSSCAPGACGNFTAGLWPEGKGVCYLFANGT